MFITDFVQNKNMVDCEIAISLCLILLNDENKKVREYACELAEAISSSKRDPIFIFTDTEKPKSVIKSQK